MGTSKSFSDLKKHLPNWPTLSRSVTTSCSDGTVPQEKLSRILGNYVSTIRPSVTGHGISKVVGSGGIRTAKRLGGFLAGFYAPGIDLRQALQSTGLSNIEGRSVDDIINHLIEYCSGPAATIDDKAAKEASRLLLEEMTASVDSIEELEQTLKSVASENSLEDILIRYFGFYIWEHLSGWFWDKLVKDKGKSDCGNLFEQIKNYILERLKIVNRTNSLKRINWGGKEAERLIDNIYKEVLIVFENHEG